MATSRSIQTFLKYPLAKEYRDAAQAKSDRWQALGQNIGGAIQGAAERKMQKELAANELSQNKELTTRELDIAERGQDLSDIQHQREVSHEEKMQRLLLEYQGDEAKAERAATRENIILEAANRLALQDDEQAFEKMMAMINKDIENGLADAEQARTEALMLLEEEIANRARDGDTAAQERLLKYQNKMKMLELDAAGQWDLRTIAAGGEEERKTQAEGAEQGLEYLGAETEAKKGLIDAEYQWRQILQDAATASEEDMAAAERDLTWRIANLDDATKRYIAELDNNTDMAIAKLSTDTDKQIAGLDTESTAMEVLFNVFKATSLLTGLGFNEMQEFSPDLLPWDDASAMEDFQNTFDDVLTLKTGGDEALTSAVLQAFDSYMARYTPPGETAEGEQPEGEAVARGGQGKQGGLFDFIFSTPDEYASAVGPLFQTIRDSVSGLVEGRRDAGLRAGGKLSAEEETAYKALQVLKDNASPEISGQAKEYLSEITTSPGMTPDIVSIEEWIKSILNPELEQTSPQYGGTMPAVRGM